MIFSTSKSKGTGVLVAGAILALLFAVLMPLPTWVIDICLSFSLGGAILLVSATTQLRAGQDFLNFPRLILVATIFRLVLNLSTTRSLLSRGEAGKVIDAFAEIVIQGDLLVGLVMFSILTVVQYLVITRGAERIAEVSARFALDGLPGAQAGIDADLRSGAISAKEAAEQRADLLIRSNFCGAMDGAMRFVKGDAVAGLVITGINLAGGVAVGTLREGMSASESLAHFGRLTVGDGLMAQIPALLISLAAGILVSQVRGRKRVELSQYAPLLLVPAACLAVFAWVPGMPTTAFLVSSSVFALVATGFELRRRRLLKTHGSGEKELTLLLPFGTDADANDLKTNIETVRQRCQRALRIEIPPIQLRSTQEERQSSSTETDLNSYRLQLGGGNLCRWTLSDAEPEKITVETFRHLIRHADLFLDLKSVHQQLDRVAEINPHLAGQASRLVEANDVLWILRAFLRERIPLPPLEGVLEVVCESDLFRSQQPKHRWLELIRERSARWWLSDLLDGCRQVGLIAWLRPTADFEQALLEAAQWDGDRYSLMLSSQELTRWREHLSASVLELGSGQSAVFLTSKRVRQIFATLVESLIPFTPVIGVNEMEFCQESCDPRTVTWVDLPLPERID